MKMSTNRILMLVGLSVTSFLGGTPVQRYELRDVMATRAADFRVNIPSDLRVEPERSEDAPRSPAGLTDAVGAVAREVGQEATKAARNFLRRLRPP